MNKVWVKIICLLSAMPVIVYVTFVAMLFLVAMLSGNGVEDQSFGDELVVLTVVLTAIVSVTVVTCAYYYWNKSVVARTAGIGAMIVFSLFILGIISAISGIILQLFSQIVLLICAGCLVFLRIEKRETIKRLHIGWRIIIDTITVSAILVSLINLLMIFCFVMLIIFPPDCHRYMLLPVNG